MTDVPQGAGRPGDDAEPDEIPGARRSSFQPPRDVSPPVDDDALADALAAQVSSFAPPPVAPPPGAEVPVVDVPVAELPAFAPPASPAPVGPPVPAAFPEDFEALGAASTLEAIELLESELRRRAEARGTTAAVEIPPPSAFEPPMVEPPPVAPPAPEPWIPPLDEIDAPVPRWEIPVIADPEPPAAPEPAAPEPVAPEAAAPEPVALAPAPEPFAPPPLIEPPTWPGQGAPATGPVDLPPPMTAPVDLPPPPGAAPVALPPPVMLPGTDAGAVLPAAPPESVPLPEADPFAAIFGRGDADIVDAEIVDAEIVDAEIDRATEWSLGDQDLAAPPSAPVPTASVVADDEVPELVTVTHPAFRVERAGPEPTAVDLRAGRAVRLFWLNFAANSSVLGVALGALVLGVGASPRQALVAVLIGVALSFLPLGIVTLASARSGQPTMVVSRAAFGLVGNALPALVALVSRVYWGGALLWALATGVAGILADAGLDPGWGESLGALLVLGLSGVLALVIAVVGYGLLARVQLVASILAGLLVVGVIVLTAPALDLSAVQQIPDGSWVGVLVAGAALVFSVVGLAWVHSAGDLARYQRPDSDGGAGMLMATLGATLPPLVLAGWGVLLAASDSRIAAGLATDPLYTIAALLPIWYPAPLIAALAVGLLSATTLTMYSAGFAVQALGLPVRRVVATVLGGVLVLAAGAALVALVADAGALLRDVATTIGVPVAAWAGVVAADLMLRRRRFHGPSLLRRGGVYPAVRVVNLLILLAASAVGFGLTTADQAGLTWQGYLWPFLGLDDALLLASDAGVLVAIGLALVLALAAGLPAIRRQERTPVE